MKCPGTLIGEGTRKWVGFIWAINFIHPNISEILPFYRVIHANIINKVSPFLFFHYVPALSARPRSHAAQPSPRGTRPSLL